MKVVVDYQHTHSDPVVIAIEWSNDNSSWTSVGSIATTAGAGNSDGYSGLGPKHSASGAGWPLDPVGRS